MNSKTKKVEIWREKATRLTMNYEDFEGSLREWQEAYFNILSHKNTWGDFNKVDLLASKSHEPFVEILVKGEQPMWDVDSIIKWLEGFGYKNIQRDGLTLGVVEETDLWDDDIDEIYVE